MPSTYPSTIATLTNPLPTQPLNAPSHSGIETAQNVEIVQIETVLGPIGDSSVVGSLQYAVRSPASNGGGHVQSANKGGTGQTAFTKGDILVATSSSVLAKLAVGQDGQGLIANSSVSSGLQYQGVATAQALQNQTNTYAVASVISASVYGITFPNIVSVLSAGQAFAIKWPTTNTSSVIALQVSSLVALRIKNPDLTNPAVGAIKASAIGIVENDGTNWQLTTTPDAEMLVGTLPALDASALVNVNVPVGSFVGGPVNGVSYTTNQTIDTTYTPNFTAKNITIYYRLRGTTSSTSVYSYGIATWNGTTITSNFIMKNSAATDNFTGAAPSFVNTIPSAGTNAANGCIATLDVITVNSTQFVVRFSLVVNDSTLGDFNFYAVATQ